MDNSHVNSGHIMHHNTMAQDIKPDISQLNVITSSSPSYDHNRRIDNGYMLPSHSPYQTNNSAPGGSQAHFFPTQQQIPMQAQMPTQQNPPQQMMSPQMLSPQQMRTSPMQMNHQMQSPTSTMSSPPMTSNTPHTTIFPASSTTKHLCAICGDRASGKHYGVYSCEGCKGFFKRTVRKDLTYACRDDRTCQIDKRQRNRCQYCRYIKCLNMGMKREAVQEERQRAKDRMDTDDSSQSGAFGSSANTDMPVEQIFDAELSVEPKNCSYVDAQKDPVTNICQAADKQLFSLVEWAKMIPHFSDLLVDDQVILLRAGWNELLIAGFSHRSIVVKDGLLLSTGLHVHRSIAHQAGVGTIFDRVLTELVAKMRELKMDRTELGCLRAIVLFNPDVKGLSNSADVEVLREKVYASLEEYCKLQYPDTLGRFAKLLLRLPALRSIGLKCMEHLFFFKLIGDAPIDTFLMEMLETPNAAAAASSSGHAHSAAQHSAAPPAPGNTV